MNIFINEIGAETAPSNGVILNEFKEQDQHQSTKNTIFNA